MLEKGHPGMYKRFPGKSRRAKVVRPRGGNLFDLEVEGIPFSETQMVSLGNDPGCFQPDAYTLVPASEAPEPLRLAPLPPSPWAVRFAVAALVMSAVSAAMAVAAVLLH